MIIPRQSATTMSITMMRAKALAVAAADIPATNFYLL